MLHLFFSKKIKHFKQNSRERVDIHTREAACGTAAMRAEREDSSGETGGPAPTFTFSLLLL